MTTQFTIPPVGTQVSVTVRFKNNYYLATTDTFDSELSGIVIPNHKQIRPDSFTLRVKCPNVPVREISMTNVVGLKFADGRKATKEKVDREIKTLVVKGSKGEEYLVTKDGKNVSCSCVGFQFRKTCKHLAMIK